MKQAFAVAVAVTLLSGCAQLQLKVPGVQVGASPGQEASSTSPSPEAASASASASGASSRDPKRVADCRAVKADPNGTQPTEEDNKQLSELSGAIRPDIGNFDVTVKGLEHLPAAEKFVADAEAKFGPWWCASTWADGSFAPNEHERGVFSLQKRIARLKKDNAAEPKWAKEQFDAALAKADKRLAEYKAVPTLRFDGSDSLTSSSSDVNSALELTAKYHWLQMKLALGESAPEVVASAAALEQARAKVKATVEEIQNLLADKFEMPKDAYKGKDAAKVKAAFAKYFADKKVVTVVLVNDWERKKGTEWHGEKLVTYDHSWIHGNIITRADDTNAEVWKVIARRDHIDGDKIKFDTYVPQMLGKMRLKNVKK